MRDESSELLESWKIGISRLPILIPALKVRYRPLMEGSHWSTRRCSFPCQS